MKNIELIMISERQAAEKLGVSAQAVGNWRRKGTGPCFKRVGTRIFYTINALETWLNGQTSGGDAA